jgi:hypothetical protein
MKLSRESRKSPYSQFRSQNKLKFFFLKLKERFAEDLQKDLQNQEEQTTQKGRRRKKNNKSKQYEQKCQSLTCSGTINSNMYDTNLSITTYSLTLSAPYSGYRAAV